MFDEPCFQSDCFLAIYCRGARYLLAGYCASLAWVLHQIWFLEVNFLGFSKIQYKCQGMKQVGNFEANLGIWRSDGEPVT